MLNQFVSAAMMFSVMVHGLPNFNHRLLHKPHKFTHIKSVVPKLGMILVLWMEFLTKKERKQICSTFLF